jgi:5-dehydro-2-deoxygluconokinase
MDGYPIEVLAIGRIGVDFYSAEEGEPLKDVKVFSRTQGGSISNIAVDLARLGHSVKLITRVGDEPLGRYLVEYLGKQGVNTSGVIQDPKHNTSLAVVEVFPPDHFTTLFFRENCADLFLTLEDIPFQEIPTVRILATSGTSLSRSPARETILSTLQRTAFLTGSKPITVFDLDYRQSLWASPAEAALFLWAAVQLADVVFANDADVVFANDEEMDVLAVLCPRERIINQILARSQMLVHKRGTAGAVVYAEGHGYEIPPFPAPKVVSTNGAGDGFAAAFLHGMLQGYDVVKCGLYGSVAGAIVVSRVGCSEAMPSLAEIEALVASAPKFAG